MCSSITELPEPSTDSSMTEPERAKVWVMALPSTYADGNCSLARALEIVGERWTLLIVRDAFYGVRRFGDFATQLDIPRASLATRLKSLVEEGVLARDEDAKEYRLTPKGIALWPAVRALMAWG